MLQRCKTWPMVRPDDDGLRAVRSGECFYCHQKIGQPHRTECVCVYAMVRYKVWMNLDRRADADDKGRLVGTFTRNDPYHWTAHDCEFHKNESSWCADNAVDYIEWNDPADAKALTEYLSDGAHCACTPLYFEFDEVTDDGPFVEAKAQPAEVPT